jgi:hypothetical protein
LLKLLIYLRPDDLSPDDPDFDDEDLDPLLAEDLDPLLADDLDPPFDELLLTEDPEFIDLDEEERTCGVLIDLEGEEERTCGVLIDLEEEEERTCGVLSEDRIREDPVDLKERESGLLIERVALLLLALAELRLTEAELFRLVSVERTPLLEFTTGLLL